MSELRQQFTQALAKRLGETKPEPIAQIERIVSCMEPDRILNLIKKVEEIELNDGMLTNDGTRRRTKGGIFFYLARTRKYGQMTRAQRRYCYPPREQNNEARIAA